MLDWVLNTPLAWHTVSPNKIFAFLCQFFAGSISFQVVSVRSRPFQLVLCFSMYAFLSFIYMKAMQILSNICSKLWNFLFKFFVKKWDKERKMWMGSKFWLETERSLRYGDLIYREEIYLDLIYLENLSRKLKLCSHT